MKHLLLTALLAGCMTTAGAQTEKAPKVPAGKTPPETIPILTEDMLWPPDDAILPAFARMKGYAIGAERWMVFPAERAVYRYEMIGGSDGGVEWDGYTYVADERFHTDFHTDGCWLLAARFPEHPVEADLESLRFSGPGIALDKNCIYDATGFGSELNVIPLEKLGIPIKVLTDIEK